MRPPTPVIPIASPFPSKFSAPRVPRHHSRARGVRRPPGGLGDGGPDGHDCQRAATAPGRPVDLVSRPCATAGSTCHVTAPIRTARPARTVNGSHPWRAPSADRMELPRDVVPPVIPCAYPTRSSAWGVVPILTGRPNGGR
jgi:hypothetical protein